MKIAKIIAGVFLFLVGLTGLFAGGIFPIVLGLILIALGVLLIWKSASHKKSVDAKSSESAAASVPEARIEQRVSDDPPAPMAANDSSLVGKIQSVWHYDRAIQSKIAEVNQLEKNLEVLRQTIATEVSQETQAGEKLKAAQTTFETESEKLNKKSNSEKRKLEKLVLAYKSVAYAIENFFNFPAEDRHLLPQEVLPEEFDLLPTVHLKLHNEDLKDLRKRFKENDRAIESLLAKYESRYNTKANATIYKLMVIALRAELQNILYSLKYEKLDVGIENIKETTAKYLAIAKDGNQSIAPTVTKFVGELEYLFINAANIEYEYYVRREKIKDEQRALREQMRQETEERRLLEQQKQQIEKEEGKYQTEISSVQAQIGQAIDEDKRRVLQDRITQLESLLQQVGEKKEEIINLQNGKAGYVYVISNLGSFGNSIFKVGMTRRLDPQDRVNELGDASVPFAFDVHSFIFSEDAVDLENRMHKALSSQRVNKINARKEFFYSSIDELESLVDGLEPSAEFNKTMLAEQYHQSLTIQEDNADLFAIHDELIEDEDMDPVLT